MAKKRKQRTYFKSLFTIILLLAIAVGGVYVWRKLNRKPAPTHFVALPDGFNTYGIDVSHHQQKIDWDTVLESSDSLISFVYCKATEGIDHIDSQWERNRKILLEKEIAHGAYHFFLPKKSAKAQAVHFLSQYKVNVNDLPPVLDAEIEGNSNQQLVSQMRIWLEYVEKKTGRRPVIYTSYNMYKEVLKASFKGYKFWVANYNTIESRFQDDEIIHWQYSDNGKIAGIKGPVDLNFSKTEF
ncbi:MAG: hypothetical protein COA33_014915 [Fluviicola sp.]|nr:hypothetical protein [Fluviicola sp.]